MVEIHSEKAVPEIEVEITEAELVARQKFRLKGMFYALVVSLLLWSAYLISNIDTIGSSEASGPIALLNKQLGISQNSPAYHENQSFEYVKVTNEQDKRADSSNDDSNNDDTSDDADNNKKTTVKSVFNSTGVRVALAFLGFVVLNLLAICIHHVIHLATKSDKSYRNVEHVISPF